MRISAKVDYAVRAVVQLADATEARPIKADVIASTQHIPVNFLENILTELRRAGLVASRRGADGGHWLTRPADRITLAEIVRTVDGPLAAVRGIRPSELEFDPPAAAMRNVWVAVRAALRDVLDHVTVADVARGELPQVVRELTSRPGAWESPATISHQSG
jgi:Rrf2 family protein